jgi:lipopolysaccharide export system permease protein
VKTAGQSVFTVLWPSIHLGIALSGLLLYLSGEAIPRANRQVKMMFFKSAEDMFYRYLKLDRQIDRSDWPFLIKVGDVKGRTMIDATFKRRAKPTPENPSPFDMVVSAKEAVVRFDLHQGVIRVHLDGAEVQLFGKHGDVAMLKDQPLEIPLPKNTPLSPLKMIQEQTNTELRALEDQYGKSLTEEPRKQALLAGLWVASGRIAKVPGEYGGMDWSGVREYASNISFWNSKRNAIETELHQRVAMACGSFFFVVLGAPVGIRFARRDFLSAFITCFLPIILVYYPLTLMGVNLGKEGLVAPVVALWAGNTLLGLLAGFVALPPVSRH